MTSGRGGQGQIAGGLEAPTDGMAGWPRPGSARGRPAPKTLSARVFAVNSCRRLRALPGGALPGGSALGCGSASRLGGAGQGEID
jgi:hypothetical protein